MHRATHPPTHRISRAEWLAVIGVLWIAFALRTVDLTRVPPGLHNDEVIETRIAETVADGRLAIFFPEDTGSEGLHYYWAALFIDVFGHGVYALRLPAVFLSLISLCVVWALTRRLFGPVAALTASAGFAVAFWPVAFGRIISHTIMLVPIAALASYCLWRAWHSTGRRAWLLWGLSGLWLGLSLYAYTAARVLPVIVVAFGVYVALTQPIDRRRWWTGIAVLLAVAAMVALPLGVVLWQNPELDDLDFFEIDRPLTELRRGNLEPVAQTALQTLGMFAFVGDPLPYYTIPGHAPGDVRPGASLTEQVYSQGRPVFEPIGALMLLAGLLISLRRWRQPEYAFIVLWFFLSLVPGMLSQPAPNSTRTLGSQVVVFALIGIAVAAIVARWRHPLVVAALGLLFVGNLVWTATDYFRVWPTIDTVRYWHNSGLKAVADSLQADPDTTPAAICLPDELIDERRPWWKPGWQHMRYLLNRPDLSLRYYNCVDAMVLLDGPARYAVPDAPDAAALQAFPVYSQFLGPANPRLDVLPDGLGTIASVDSAAARRLHADLDRRLADMAESWPVMWAPEAGGGIAALPVEFGGTIDFLGYTLQPAVGGVQAGSSFQLVTWWRVIETPPQQLLQFTHVLNPAGEIVAQQDRLAITSAGLRPGDVFAQAHRVALPADLPAGEYALSIGLYTAPDEVRLPVTGTGRPRGNRLWLRSLSVP